MSDQKCSTQVWADYSNYPCTRKGTVEQNGKWYCWQHDPERIKTVRLKAQAKGEARWERKWKIIKRKEEALRICQGVSTDELQLLEDGAVKQLLKT